MPVGHMRFGLTNFIPQRLTEFPALAASPSMLFQVPVCDTCWVPALAASAPAFPAHKSSAGWALRSTTQMISHWRKNWSPGVAGDTQPAASSSNPVLCLGFVILKAVVLRAVLAQENLSFHSRKRPTPCFCPCKCTVTTSELTGCYWLEAQLRAGQILLSRSGTEGRSPQTPSCKSCPWIPPQTMEDDHLSLQRQLWPPHTLCLNPGTSASSTRLRLWRGNHEGNSFDEEPKGMT